MNKIIFIFFACALLFGACKKEETPTASIDLGIVEQFTPPADADPLVKDLFEKYGLWVRMDFDNWKEVTNAILDIDQLNRWGVEKIENEDRASALIYTQSLLSNVSEVFSKKFFPLDFFFVKSYGQGYWAADIKRIGRSRLVICWPNEMTGALPVTNPEGHYYKDSVLTRQVWSNIANMVAARMEEPIQEFALAGKSYDNGESYDKIMNEYYADGEVEKRDASLNELAKNGGFISGSGSRTFDSDFSEWLRLLVTESAFNIQTKYLNNSPARAKKYEILIRYFQNFGWDIQAAGNKYRSELDG